MKSTLQKLVLITTMTIVSASAFAADLSVGCYQKGTTINASAVPLVSFSIANNSSNRLVGDLFEYRSNADFEFLSASSVSQYKFQTLELLVETDDSSANGTQVAALQAIYTPKKSGEKARYNGIYKRFDAGRKLQVQVVCVVK